MRVNTYRRLILLVLLLVVPVPVSAQVERAAIGGALGVVGGAGLTLAAVVARARLQREYLEDLSDLIHWQSTPMIVAPAAGIVFGLAGPEALKASIVGSMGGMVIGAAIGAGLGWALTTDQEGPWAGGVIGAGVGLATGGLVEGLRAWSETEDPGLEFPRMLRLTWSVPLR